MSDIEFKAHDRCHELPPTWGADSLAVAQSILGWGEVGGNNRGPDIDIIRHGRKLKAWQPGYWCADTCFYELSMAWAERHYARHWLSLPPIDREKCPVKWTPSARKLGKRIAKAGSYVDEEDIRPGDFVVFARKGGSHIAIILWVGDGEYKTIDGNKGRYNKRTGHGSKVAEFNHEFGEPVRFFCRLPEFP